MAALTEFVTVNIAVADASIAQASFSKILATVYHTVGTERIRDYTDPTAFNTDFAAWPAALAVGAAFFAQNPRPTTLSIGRLITPMTKGHTLTPTVQNSTLYRTIVNGLNADYTSPNTGATLAAICTGIAAAITALAQTGVTASSTGTTVTTAGTSGTWYSIQSATPLITVLETTATPANLATELAGILAERNDCYGLVHQDHSDAIIGTVSAFAQSNGKQYGWSSSNPTIPTSSTSDIASLNQAAAYDHVFGMWSHQPDLFPEMRIMAEEFAWQPGSRTWAFKKPVGAASSDAYITATGLTYIKSKNLNRITTFGGVVIFVDGKEASGRFIDVTLGIDWLTQRMMERFAAVLVNTTDKVTYDDTGIANLQGAMAAQLQEAVRLKVLADDDQLYTSVLPAGSQNPNDRTSRIVRGLAFHGRLAGAVHIVVISGVVTA